VEQPAWLLHANNALLPFRMPTLMFLSGMLLSRALAKPNGVYYLGKLRTLIWPYLVWAPTYILLFGSEGAIFKPGAWIASGYLWFLFFITLYYLAAPLLAKLPVWVAPVAAWAASFALPEGIWQKGAFFAVFFFLGHVANSRSSTMERIYSSRLVWFGVPLVGFTAAMSTIFDTESDPWTVPGSLAGIILIISSGRQWFSANPSPALEFVGRKSLTFYVSHFPVMALTFMALSEVTSSAWVSFPVLLIVGAGVSWLLAKLSTAPPVSWLYKMPWPKTQVVANARTTTERIA
jgi:uncharacterized membrane protein YcfT